MTSLRPLLFSFLTLSLTYPHPTLCQGVAPNALAGAPGGGGPLSSNRLNANSKAAPPRAPVPKAQAADRPLLSNSGLVRQASLKLVPDFAAPYADPIQGITDAYYTRASLVFWDLGADNPRMSIDAIEPPAPLPWARPAAPKLSGTSSQDPLHDPTIQAHTLAQITESNAINIWPDQFDPPGTRHHFLGHLSLTNEEIRALTYLVWREQFGFAGSAADIAAAVAQDSNPAAAAAAAAKDVRVAHAPPSTLLVRALAEKLGLEIGNTPAAELALSEAVCRRIGRTFTVEPTLRLLQGDGKTGVWTGREVDVRTGLEMDESAKGGVKSWPLGEKDLEMVREEQEIVWRMKKGVGEGEGGRVPC